MSGEQSFSRRGDDAPIALRVFVEGDEVGSHEAGTYARNAEQSLGQLVSVGPTRQKRLRSADRHSDSELQRVWIWSVLDDYGHVASLVARTSARPDSSELRR